MKSHLHFILFLNIKKKLGVTSHAEELGPIEGSHVFDYICTQNVLTHAQTFNFDVPARPCYCMEMAQNFRM